MKSILNHKSFSRSTFFACALLVASTATALGTTINHPSDGYTSVQAAVNAAGCGGTVYLAAGTYNERILLTCGSRLIGAGVGQTIIDGTNLTDPNGAPVIGLGNHPFVVFPFTQDYELANLTVRAGVNTTPQGVATGWSSNVSIHDLEITGFSTGLAIDLSFQDKIHDVSIVGAGPTLGRCIYVRERDVFETYLTDGHMSSQEFHHNALSNCNIGLELQNSLGAVIQHNRVERTSVGVRLFGVGQTDVQQNFIANSSVAGIVMSNSEAATIHHNTLCSNATAVRYSQSVESRFGFAPSTNNLVHHNTFGLNGAGIVILDTLLGQGNRDFQNNTNASVCQ